METPNTNFLIGTSGFSYQHWRGVFYPDRLAPSHWLSYYTAHFETVELNTTFYRLPSETAVQRWLSLAPMHFRFAVKLSRYITHTKRLLDAGDALARFLARVGVLEDHLGPILIQLPPLMQKNLPRLEAFLQLCSPTYQWAIEFRNDDWLADDTYQLLKKTGVALCIHDMIREHPRVCTADFTYVRFHGYDTRYGGDYPDFILQEWSEQLHAWQLENIGGFVYFNNDAHGYAVKNATTLKSMFRGS